MKHSLITPGERSWIRIERCIVDLLSAFCGFWPDNGNELYKELEWDQKESHN